MQTINLQTKKSPANNKTETILKITKKSFQDWELSNKLFLITRKTTKKRNAFANNMSTDT